MSRNPRAVTQRSSEDQLVDLLRILQQKVETSAALNGGFDTLLFKMEKIEEGQNQMGTKVSSIHDAIYHPDDGLFARVKVIEGVKSKVESIDAIEKDVLQLKQLQEVSNKGIEKCQAESAEQTKAIKEHADHLKELVEWKHKFGIASRWLIVTLAGGGATIVGKLIIDFVQGHISFH